MPPRSFFSQIGKVDFFAVLSSGFFIFLVLYVSFGDVVQEDYSIWNSLEVISGEIKQQPALLLFIFFASYLLGSILRAFPVKWVGRLIPRKGERMPYPSIVSKLLDGLREKSGAALIDVSRLPDLSNGLSMEVFNGCVPSPVEN